MAHKKLMGFLKFQHRQVKNPASAHVICLGKILHFRFVACYDPLSGSEYHWGRSFYLFRERGYNIRWSWSSSTQNVDEHEFIQKAKDCSTAYWQSQPRTISKKLDSARITFNCLSKHFPGKGINVVRRLSHLWIRYRNVHFYNEKYNSVWIMA